MKFVKLIQLTTLSFVLSIFLSHSAKAGDYQHSARFAQEIGRSATDPFLPITFSQEGIDYFLRNVFNDSKYGTEFLPNDFSHLLQFLQHGLDANQGPEFAQSVFRLFSNKLKAATYVNAYAFADALTPLQNILQNYFVETKSLSIKQLKTSVSDVLYSSFLSQFDFFKRDPKMFFNNLSTEILSSLHHELAGPKKEIAKDQLRQTTVRFMELCASKLVWSPEESAEIWKTVQSISDQLALLVKNRIITNVDLLDDLFWSLTHRFCFFLELTGSDLPPAFYQNIKQDLLRNNSLLCKLKEQERALTKKSDYLMQAIVTGEAKARAQQAGIVV